MRKLAGNEVEELTSRRGDDAGRWRSDAQRVRLLVGASFALLAIGTLIVATNPPGAPGRPAADRAGQRPGVEAGPAEVPEVGPVRVPPLCEMRTEFSVPGEPVMDGPPGCPIGLPRTPAGDYVSTAFVGHSSLLPYTFTLPDNWFVHPRGHGLVVHLATLGKRRITVVSDPVLAGTRAPLTPKSLMRRLGDSHDLKVRRARPLLAGPPWWKSVEVSLRPGVTVVQGDCEITPCVPVLASGYGDEERTTVGVRPGDTARLLVNGWAGAHVAVWIWDVTDHVTDQTLAVARSIQLWPPRPALPLN